MINTFVPAQEMLHLKPGELLVMKEPAVVTTVLGSCVSVIFHSPRFSISAINHAVLPTSSGHHTKHDEFKFADISLYHIIDNFNRMGIKKTETIVKIFGGSDMFSFREGRHESLKIGHNNIRVSLEVLRKEGFIITACDVGGTRGRRVYLKTETGDVLIKRLIADKNSQPDRVNDCRNYL